MSISLRIGNEVYRRVEAESMTPEQAEVAAHEIGVDIGALALFLKEQGLDKDYQNAMMIAERFEGMANAIAKKSLQKAASFVKADGDYGQEMSVPLNGGRELRCPAYPEPCEYVRIIDASSGEEIVYWDSGEWQEAPEEVMGAIVGAMVGSNYSN